jgi:simple sugar transport system substrate-binding protein
VRRVLAIAFLLVAVAGCGGTTTVREDDIVVREAETPQERPAPEATPERGGGLRLAAARIAVVSHGQASDPFWTIVKKGLDDAARQTGVAVSYRAPDTYDLPRMRRLIDEAISARLDGLIVSLPDVQALAAPIRRAERAGIPVVSINSGSDVAGRLGVLAHVGQPEERAGYVAGRRLAAAGVRRALCVNQQVGNQGLDDRCAGLSRAMRRTGGSSRVLSVDDQSSSTPRRLAATIVGRRIDGVLALNATTGVLTLDAVRRSRRARSVTIGTFDLGPEVLGAVRDGRIRFAVDQQAYLQGYMPVTMLAQRARYGLFPSEGDVIATGPHFVTKANAAQALDLSRRSIR